MCMKPSDLRVFDSKLIVISTLARVCKYKVCACVCTSLHITSTPPTPAKSLHPFAVTDFGNDSMLLALMDKH